MRDPIETQRLLDEFLSLVAADPDGGVVVGLTHHLAERTIATVAAVGSVPDLIAVADTLLRNAQALYPPDSPHYQKITKAIEALGMPGATLPNVVQTKQ